MTKVCENDARIEMCFSRSRGCQGLPSLVQQWVHRMQMTCHQAYWSNISFHAYWSTFHSIHTGLPFIPYILVYLSFHTYWSTISFHAYLSTFHSIHTGLPFIPYILVYLSIHAYWSTISFPGIQHLSYRVCSLSN